MNKMSVNQLQSLSFLLVLSMAFSTFFVVLPPAQASVGSVARSIFVNVGGVAAGIFGGAIGAAIGWGPLGMGVGALGGYIVGKKVLNWTTSSFGNFATVAGAIAGGALTIGMGFPMLAAGVIGGALIGKVASSAISKIFGDKKPVLITEGQVNIDAVKKESDAIASILAGFNPMSSSTSPTSAVQAPVLSTSSVQSLDAPAEITSQQAYETYVSAYKNYMNASNAGNTEAAQKAYSEYQIYLDLYNTLVKSGK